MDAEQEQVEDEAKKREQQTEAHEEVLAALKQLWKAGKCKRDLIDNRPYYFIEEWHEDISDTKTTEEQYNKYNNTTLQHYNNAT